MNKKLIPLTKKQLKKIVANNSINLQANIIQNTFYSRCSATTTIENYMVYLNNLRDIVLKDFCSKYHQPVTRYIGTENQNIL